METDSDAFTVFLIYFKQIIIMIFIFYCLTVDGN